MSIEEQLEEKVKIQEDKKVPVNTETTVRLTDNQSKILINIIKEKEDISKIYKMLEAKESDIITVILESKNIIKETVNQVELTPDHKTLVVQIK